MRASGADTPFFASVARARSASRAHKQTMRACGFRMKAAICCEAHQPMPQTATPTVRLPAGNRTVGVAVCGIGWCASQHIAAFMRNPHARIVCLCARDAERARATLAKNGVSAPDARMTTSYDEVLDSRDVDIVSIATPNHLHAEQAAAAARAGKHLLLEKPTGLDVDELVRIRNAVREAGV